MLKLINPFKSLESRIRYNRVQKHYYAEGWRDGYFYYYTTVGTKEDTKFNPGKLHEIYLCNTSGLPKLRKNCTDVYSGKATLNSSPYIYPSSYDMYNDMDERVFNTDTGEWELISRSEKYFEDFINLADYLVRSFEDVAVFNNQRFAYYSPISYARDNGLACFAANDYNKESEINPDFIWNLSFTGRDYAEETLDQLSDEFVDKIISETSDINDDEISITKNTRTITRKMISWVLTGKAMLYYIKNRTAAGVKRLINLVCKISGNMNAPVFCGNYDSYSYEKSNIELSNNSCEKGNYINDKRGISRELWQQFILLDNTAKGCVGRLSNDMLNWDIDMSNSCHTNNLVICPQLVDDPSLKASWKNR